MIPVAKCKKEIRSIIRAVCFCIVLHGCTTPKKTAQPMVETPGVEREFRAAWVATVANINWPSKPGLPVDSQQKEAIRLLDFLQQHHFNAVILQVRPQADALYKSDLEPWSYFLTGQQGRAPQPFYDPLNFWIEEAHRRGLELHVWLNPYRAHHISGGEVTEHSLVKKKPELVVHLKEGYWWFDPAKTGTREHSAAVVMDIVKRYDIDGVHFDDYFYPYPSYNKNEDFPDGDSWEAYQKAGGKLSRGDWRRDAVNGFIRDLYQRIKAEKKKVKFGLSPFGIWRPGHPASVGGFDQYDVLYADAKLWLNEGWIDYFSPQLYWPISRPQQSFPVLLGWWQQENRLQRHLWPGMNVGRDTGAATVMETINQVMITRGMLPKSAGAIHWSISSVVSNSKLAKALIDGPYRKQALVPASPWLDAVAPGKPQVSIDSVGNTYILNWKHDNPADVFQWVIYSKYGSSWSYRIISGNHFRDTVLHYSVLLSGRREALGAVGVAAVDRCGNLSEPDIVKVVVPTGKEDRLYPGIIPRAGWNAALPRPYKSQTPVRITIHHEGTKLEVKDDAARKIKAIQTWGMGPDRNWVDIPYHFLISPGGKIYEGRSVHTVGETATEYDPSGHLLISCLGNLEEQPVTPEQLKALTDLLAYCSVKYNIPVDSIASHRDYSTQTTCPGRNLYQYLQNGYIRETVTKKIAE